MVFIIKKDLAPKVRHIISLGQSPKEMTILTFLALKGRNKWYVALSVLKTIYSLNLGRCPRLLIYRPDGAQFEKNFNHSNP